MGSEGWEAASNASCKNVHSQCSLFYGEKKWNTHPRDSAKQLLTDHMLSSNSCWWCVIVAFLRRPCQ